MKQAALCLIIAFSQCSLIPLSAQQLEEELELPEVISAGINLDQANVDSLYLAANSLYQQGQYEPALERYHAIILSGKESADLYYNMGNAAYRSNSIGHAILYYEKALKLEPTHQDAIHNLEYVSRYRPDTFEEVPALFLGTWIAGFVNLFPEHIWSMLAMIFFLIILSGLLIYLFSRQMILKKLGFISGLAALLLFMLSLLSAIGRHQDIVNPEGHNGSLPVFPQRKVEGERDGRLRIERIRVVPAQLHR